MAIIEKIFSITHFLNIIVIVMIAASIVVAFLDIYKVLIAERAEMANKQLKHLNQKMQLSLAHLYYVTMSFLGLWFAFLIVSVAMKEHEAAGPGFICVLFVMLFICLMDIVDTKLRKLKLLESSIEVPLTSTIMMRAALTAAERKQQKEEKHLRKNLKERAEGGSAGNTEQLEAQRADGSGTSSNRGQPSFT